MKSESENFSISIRFNNKMVEEIDNYATKNNYMSRSDVIRDLVRRGLRWVGTK